MNWIGKLESMFVAMRDMSYQHWEIGFILAIFCAAAAVVISLKVPSKSAEMRAKARIMRYCHDCPYVDMQTETCSIQAAAEQKCGLIDKTAGMKFNVTKAND